MKQIIAIGGGGFGREIGELKIEKYIVKQSNKSSTTDCNYLLHKLSTIFLISLMCSVVVLQQPPTTEAPFSIHCTTKSLY